MTTTSKFSTRNIPDFVPNGTPLSMVNEPVQPLIRKYLGFAKAGAEGVIDQCETLVTAEYELSPKNFEAFCAAIKLDPKSSTCRKLRAVGEAATRLKAAIDKLPNSWTTLYQLSKLDADDFDRLVTNGQLHPSITAAEIKAAITEPKEPPAERLIFIVDLTDPKHGQVRTIFEEFVTLAGKVGVSIKQSPALKQLISETDQQRLNAA